MLQTVPKTTKDGKPFEAREWYFFNHNFVCPEYIACIQRENASDMNAPLNLEALQSISSECDIEFPQAEEYDISLQPVHHAATLSLHASGIVSVLGLQKLKNITNLCVRVYISLVEVCQLTYLDCSCRLTVSVHSRHLMACLS
jgi:hypothetical protein